MINFCCFQGLGLKIPTVCLSSDGCTRKIIYFACKLLFKLIKCISHCCVLWQFIHNFFICIIKYSYLTILFFVTGLLIQSNFNMMYWYYFIWKYIKYNNMLFNYDAQFVATTFRKCACMLFHCFILTYYWPTIVFLFSVSFKTNKWSWTEISIWETVKH